MMKSKIILEASDYKPIRSPLEKKMVIFLLKFFAKKVTFRAVISENESIIIGKGVPKFSIAIPNLRSTLAICFFPSYMFAQQYCRGNWYSEEELSEFIIHIVSKSKNKNKDYNYSIIDRIIHVWNNYFDKNASRKVSEHYDVDYNFYKLLLGDELVYSCAFFDDEHRNLGQAQSNKLTTTFQRLSVDTTDEKLRILDVGCGWGGMVKYLADNTCAKIDAISISPEQCNYNNNSIGQFYGKDKVNFFKSDIVDFSPDEHGCYDRIVSVAMLEHVGKKRFDEYFSCIKALLKPNGLAVVHFIVKEKDGYNNAWIDKHVFPGGYIPKIDEVTDSVKRSGLKLKQTHMHDGVNYKKTLQFWKENLIENSDECYQVLRRTIEEKSKGLNQDIEYLTRSEMRKWYFYLSSVQAMFDDRAFGDNICQIVVEKDG